MVNLLKFETCEVVGTFQWQQQPVYIKEAAVSLATPRHSGFDTMLRTVSESQLFNIKFYIKRKNKRRL